ncbi:unnamed protein product, partial [Medioppia subpectinata]
KQWDENCFYFVTKFGVFQGICVGNEDLAEEATTDCPHECNDNKSNKSDTICASNGNTYESICRMKLFNCSLTQVDWEHCRGRHPLCPSDCLDIQDPVCAEGRALDSCPDTCLEFPKPVCGTDGQIYLNECQLRQMNCDQDVKVVPMNQCAKKSSCPEQCLAIYDPVCGSDGKVYLNHCKMLYENCETSIKRMPLRFCVGDDEQKL